ncbi:MAG: arginine repressor [Butyrivibrio sp.]|nr:arginine repressor [Butyrivibrio sp.]
MKKNRLDKIIEVIATNEVETQDQLVALLNKEGYKVTQATVSRDIRKLKLTKQVNADGVSKYVYSTVSPELMQSKYVSVLKAGFVSMDVAQNLLVIKTVSGMAMALATAIDSLEFKEIVGCIAGDDTIMIAIKSNEEAEKVMNQLRKMMQQ